MAKPKFKRGQIVTVTSGLGIHRRSYKARIVGRSAETAFGKVGWWRVKEIREDDGNPFYATGTVVLESNIDE